MFQQQQILLKGLKDFLKCSYYNLIRRYTYPVSILPKFNYKPEIDINALCKKQRVFIMRRTECPHNLLETELGTLRNDIVEIKEIPGLSMNLMGSFYKVNHIKYIPLNQGTDVWDGDKTIFLSDNFTNYKILNGLSPIYFEAHDLHNIDIPFVKEKDKDAEKLFKTLKFDSEEKDGMLRAKPDGKLLVAHVPVNLNYWHIELKVKDSGGEILKKGKKEGVNKVLSTHILNHILTVKYKLSLDDIIVTQINEIHYYKS